MKNSNIAKDSLLLTIVRVVSLATSIIQVMFLTRIMTLEEYGVYSELLIIISIMTTVTSLGLSNAVNYFYNKEKDEKLKEKYVNIIFIITLISGIIGAIIILLSKQLIIDYYNNNSVNELIIYIVSIPLFTNIIAIFQALYISVGKAKFISVISLISSIVHAVLIPFSYSISKNIKIIFIVNIIIYIVEILYLFIDLRSRIKLNIKNIKIQRNMLKKIFSYSIPMALALMVGILLKETDKLVIAKLMDVESLAIYANMSKQLPFEFIATSFTAVITPVIVRLYVSDTKKMKELWSDYMEFGYITTWILCVGAIICSKEILVILYSEKYIAGLSVFIIYLFIEMFRFAYFGMMLSAIGKPKYILFSSILALVMNVVLNIILYYAMGLIGPAVASLICAILMQWIQLRFSCKIVGTTMKSVLRVKNAAIVLVKLIGTGIFLYMIKEWLSMYIKNDILICIIIYGSFIAINALLNKKRLVYLYKNMNNTKA